VLDLGVAVVVLVTTATTNTTRGVRGMSPPEGVNMRCNMGRPIRGGERCSRILGGLGPDWLLLPHKGSGVLAMTVAAARATARPSWAGSKARPGTPVLGFAVLCGGRHGMATAGGDVGRREEISDRVRVRLIP
jgi:hypothetical protein